MCSRPAGGLNARCEGLIARGRFYELMGEGDVESVPIRRSVLEALRLRDPQASYDEIIAELLCVAPPAPFVRDMERRASQGPFEDGEEFLRKRGL